MLNEINKLNNIVLRHYPSSQNVLANLASKSFPVNKDNLIIANGVCEIINNIMTKLEGEFEIASPFFLEYMRLDFQFLVQFQELFYF